MKTSSDNQEGGQPTREVILIDLDVLLDTRLAALLATDSKWTTDFLEEGYRSRNTDAWDTIKPGIDMVKYRDIYDNRDEELLKASRLTGFMINLLKIVKVYEIDLACNSDQTSSVTVVINTYPYNLTEAVEYNIVAAIKEHIGTVVDTRITHEPHSNLSIRYLANNGYTQYALYEFAKWCGYHFVDENNFTSMVGKYNFAVIAPQLCVPLDPAVQQDLMERNLTEEDPFELTKVVFASMMDLSFLPLESFSLLDASKIEAELSTPI